MHMNVREAVPIHNMLPGFTDAKAYTELGMKCWGFSPLMLPEGAEFASLFHGHNERIDVESLRLTTQLWLDVLDRFWERGDA